MVVGALEGHPGVIDVAFDLRAERFDVCYDAAETSTDELLAVVRSQGYDPSIVEVEQASAEAVGSVDIAELPEELQADFRVARRSGRKVLLDFTAPG